MGTKAQYKSAGTQQEAIRSQFKIYKELTNEMNVNCQANEAAIQQPHQVIQSKQLALQALQTNQFVNQ